MTFKSWIILIGLAAGTAGLLGPTIFIETMGHINLFQLADRLQTDLYLYIGLGFAAILGLSFLFLLLRLGGWVWFFAMLGIITWVVSYYYFNDFHSSALEQVKHIGPKHKFVYYMQALMVRNLQLQWGAWTLLGGLVIMFLTVALRRK